MNMESFVAYQGKDQGKEISSLVIVDAFLKRFPDMFWGI